MRAQTAAPPGAAPAREAASVGEFLRPGRRRRAAPTLT